MQCVHERWLTIRQEKKWHRPFAATQMGFEDTTLGEISQRQIKTQDLMPHVWELKKQNSQKQTEKWGWPGPGGAGE